MSFKTRDVVFTKLYFQGKGKWKLWAEDLANVPLPKDIPVNQIIITTVETVRNMAIMKLLVTHNKGLMFVGPTGTGKSVYVIVSYHKKTA